MIVKSTHYDRRVIMRLRWHLSDDITVRRRVSDTSKDLRDRVGAMACPDFFRGAIPPSCPEIPSSGPLSQRLEVYGNLEFGQDNAYPCRLGKCGTVEGEAEATDFDAEAILGGECDTAQTRESYALDRDTGDDANESKEDE